ncbi:hypothetical protein ACWU4D_08695 [Vibrio sp. WJH972]
MRFALLSFAVMSSAYAAQFDSENYSTSLDFAQVTHVDALQTDDGSWCFNTSVRHNDQGWDHYADGWEVIDLDGNQLGYRLLAHPHDNEQPFTRRQCGIHIPEAVTHVAVRAKCNQHGYGGKAVVIDLNSTSGQHYSIRRQH